MLSRGCFHGGIHFQLLLESIGPVTPKFHGGARGRKRFDSLQANFERSVLQLLLPFQVKENVDTNNAYELHPLH